MSKKSSNLWFVVTALPLFLCIVTSIGAPINNVAVQAQTTTTTITTIVINATNTTTTSAPSDYVPWTWKPIFVVAMLACLLLSLAFDLLNNIAGLFIISAVFHLSGIISEKEFFAGFSNGGVASLALIYVLTDPIKSLPSVRKGANYIFAGEKGAKYWPLIKTLIFCLVSSTVLPNKPQVALVVPIVVETCRASGLHPQFLLQPVNIAIHLANYFSMSSSSNLVTEGLMETKGLQQIGFFEFSKTAVVASIGTCAAMVVLAGLMFESELPADISELEEENKQDFTSFHCMMHVMSRCRFIGKTWAELFDELPSEYLRKVKVLKIWRASGRVVGDATAADDDTTEIQAHKSTNEPTTHDAANNNNNNNKNTTMVVTTNTNDDIQRKNFNKHQPLFDEMKNLAIERGDEILVAGFPEHLRSFHHLAGFAWVGLSPLELGPSNDANGAEPSSGKKAKKNDDETAAGHELEMMPTMIFEQQESCQNDNATNNIPHYKNNNAFSEGRLECENSAVFAERDNDDNNNNTVTATSRGDDAAEIGPEDEKPVTGDETTTKNAMTGADSPDFPKKSSRQTQQQSDVRPEENNTQNNNNNARRDDENIPASVTATPSLVPHPRKHNENIDDNRLQRRDTIVVFGKEATLTDHDDEDETYNNTRHNSELGEGEQLQQLCDLGQGGIILHDNNNGQQQQQQQEPFSVLPASVSYRVKRSNISRRLQAFESDSAEFADNFIVTLSSDNRWIGHALGHSHFVSRLNCFVMGIRTHDGIHLPPFQFHVHRLAEGDQLLIRVGKSFFARHSQSGEFMSIESVSHEKLVHSVQESYWKVPDWIPFNIGTSILPTTSQQQQQQHHGSNKTSKTTSKNPTPAVAFGKVPTSESANKFVSAFPSSPSTKHGTITTKTTGSSPLLLSPKQQHDQDQLFTSRYITIPKWWNSLSLVILCGVIAATMGGVALNTSSIVGIFALVAIGVQSPREAVLAIDWVVITATALSFGIGAAISNSGLSKIIANALAGSSVSGFGLVLLLSFLSGITSAFLQDTGAVQLLFPIYIRVFRDRGLDEKVAAVILANGVIAGFFTSFGCSSNLIIAGPGNYRGRDFITYGFPVFVVWHILVSAMEYAVYF